MSNIDKRALREAAEKATDSRARLELMESVFDDDGDVTPEAQDDISICMSFNGLTNPATVLALLDELEAKDRQLIQLQQKCEIDPRTHQIIDLKERIAELEAREVTLPPTFWYEHDDLPRDIPVLARRLVIKALREADIKIAAGTAKGE